MEIKGKRKCILKWRIVCRPIKHLHFLHGDVVLVTKEINKRHLLSSTSLLKMSTAKSLDTCWTPVVPSETQRICRGDAPFSSHAQVQDGTKKK